MSASAWSRIARAVAGLAAALTLVVTLAVAPAGAATPKAHIAVIRSHRVVRHHHRRRHTRRHHRTVRRRHARRHAVRRRHVARRRAHLTAGPRTCANAHTPARATSSAVLRRAVVCLINKERMRRGLPRLHANRRLNRSAQRWTNAMVARSAFSHGADFSARITAAGFVWSAAAENIATGYGTPAAVVRGWMASTGHCENILSPMYLDVGTGISRHPVRGFASGAATWTQDFGLPMGHRQPSHNWGPATHCPY